VTVGPRRAIPVSSLLAAALAVLAGAGAARADGRAPAAPTATAAVIAVLPLENWSGNPETAALLSPALRDALARRRCRAVPAAAVEAALARRRIRELSVVGRADAVALCASLGAGALLVASGDTFGVAEAAPRLGITARLLDGRTGETVWAGAAGLAGDECEGLLRLGRVGDPSVLADRLVERLLADFPPAPAWRAWRPAARAEAGIVDSSRARGVRKVATIALLPLENRTQRPGAGKIATELLDVALARGRRFRLASRADIAGALGLLDVPYYVGLDRTEMLLVAMRAPCDAMLFGAVEDWSEGVRPGQPAAPEVEISARLVDVRTGKLLWIGGVRAAGDDGIVVLDVGRVRCMTTLVERAAAALAGQLEKEIP
jgi:hypothetical protein